MNHNGDIKLAHKLIDAAKEAGADVVKFQTYDCEKLDPPGERREMLRKLQLSREDHFDLKKHCDDIGIEFLSTPFDTWSLKFLVETIGVKRIKIASGYFYNEQMLDAAHNTGLQVLLSAGMSECRDADHAVAIFGWYYAPEKLTVMHCTSSYPCPDADVNLSYLAKMKTIIGRQKFGFSDHSEGIVAPIGAVALGATVIEKHLTLDCNMDGPDHKASIDPAQFAEMVKAIRRMEVMLGDGVKRIMPSESAALAIAEERKAWRVSLS